MEAAVVNVLSSGDEVVVLSGGTFGHRWSEIAERYGADCKLLEVPQGYSVSPDEIREKISKNTKAVFVTANETSSGVLIDVEGIGKIVRDTDAILVVDAVSSLGADRLDMDAWGLDVVITSSQKALALPPGLSFISVSEKAWNRINKSNLPKYYFDLKYYRDNIRRGQTPFTPPISLLYQLDVRLDMILKKGHDNVIEEQRTKALYLKDRLGSLNLEVIGKNHSSGVLGIRFPGNVDAFSVVQSLRENYGIEITPSPGEDKSRVARVGLFGEITMKDIDGFIDSLTQVLNQHRSVEE